MVHIVFITESNYYQQSTVIPLAAGLLSTYLTADLGSNIESTMEWITSSEDEWGAHNATQFSKEDGIVTFIPEDIVNDHEAIAAGDFFQIRADVLGKLVLQWDAVRKQKPERIEITIDDNDNVHVIGIGKRAM